MSVSTTTMPAPPPTSRTDWSRLDTQTDDAMDTSDIPELTPAARARMTRRVGGLRRPRPAVPPAAFSTNGHDPHTADTVPLAPAPDPAAPTP